MLFFLTSFPFLLPSPYSLVPSAAAQRQILTVAPPRLELSASPGGEIRDTVKLINDGDSSLKITLEKKDFIVLDDKGTPIMIEASPRSSRWAMATWITPDLTEFELEPHSHKIVTLHIRVPKDATPGGRYASVLFKPEVQEIGRTGAAVATKVASLLSMRVAGDITENARATQFKTDKKFYEYGPVKFTTRIQNLGDSHIRPQGEIEIKDLLGREVKGLKLEPVNIFPLAERTYENTWDKKWLFGKFYATLSGTYGEAGLPLTATATFWIIPWKIAAGGASIILLGAIITIVLRKRRRSRSEALREGGKEEGIEE